MGRRRVGPGTRQAKGPRSGFSLLEILVAVAVFGITMAALTTTQVTTVALSRANLETSAALDAAQSVMEAIRDEDDFTKIFAHWNGTTADDAGEVAPGNAFDVRGLEPAADDDDGRVGEIVFPGDGKKLREDVTDRMLGMPRDLNLDGGPLDGKDHAADYRILPVMVRVRWTGASGVHEMEVVGTLARR